MFSYPTLCKKLREKFSNQELKEIMGPRNEYYIHLIERGSYKFNFIAAIFTLPWLIYRRLYKHLLILAPYTFLVTVMNHINKHLNFSILLNTILIVITGLALIVYYGKNANYIYFKKIYLIKKGSSLKYNHGNMNRLRVILTYSIFCLLNLGISLLYNSTQKNYQATYSIDSTSDYYIGRIVSQIDSNNNYRLIVPGIINNYFIGISEQGKVIEQFELPYNEELDFYFVQSFIFHNDSYYIIGKSGKSIFKISKDKIVSKETFNYMVKRLHIENNEVTHSRYADKSEVPKSKGKGIFNYGVDMFGDDLLFNNQRYTLTFNNNFITYTRYDESGNVIINKELRHIIANPFDFPSIISIDDYITIAGFNVKAKKIYISKIDFNGKPIKTFSD